MESTKRHLELEEYVEQPVAPSEIKEPEARYILENHGTKVSVDAPSWLCKEWKVTSRGWVGHIPVLEDLELHLKPKVEITNIFRMLEYAYNLRSFKVLEGLTGAQSIEDVFQRLAGILAGRVLDRSRRGLYREYVPEEDQLPYVRGNLDLRRQLREHWKPHLPCRYQDHTADVEENRILAWTLRRVARSGICRSSTQARVRKAYRAVAHSVTPEPMLPADCIGRLYNRLNSDYELLHALCRFFLENSGPTHETGDSRSLPFLVNMNNLFELFVAKWLQAHVPPEIQIDVQHDISFGDHDEISFEIDLVAYDSSTGNPFAVLDTKYKRAEHASNADVSQVIAYAEAMECPEAVLIYPIALGLPLNHKVGSIRVRTATFSLDGDLEENGQGLLRLVERLYEDAQAREIVTV